mmetsp:Transcript_2961/g.5026  ORF Transcript_2961/g.5026 Transcript_2961/m.5026 type:complete len:233 (-) Transcript_2961:546-1244(-)
MQKLDAFDERIATAHLQVVGHESRVFRDTKRGVLCDGPRKRDLFSYELWDGLGLAAKAVEGDKWRLRKRRNRLAKCCGRRHGIHRITFLDHFNLHLNKRLDLDCRDRNFAIALRAMDISDSDTATVNKTLHHQGIADGDALRVLIAVIHIRCDGAQAIVRISAVLSAECRGKRRRHVTGHTHRERARKLCSATSCHNDLLTRLDPLYHIHVRQHRDDSWKWVVRNPDIREMV